MPEPVPEPVPDSPARSDHLNQHGYGTSSFSWSHPCIASFYPRSGTGSGTGSGTNEMRGFLSPAISTYSDLLMRTKQAGCLSLAANSGGQGRVSVSAYPRAW